MNNLPIVLVGPWGGALPAFGDRRVALALARLIVCFAFGFIVKLEHKLMTV